MSPSKRPSAKARRALYGQVAAGICIALVVATLVAGYLWHRHAVMTEASDWTPIGPQCPALAKATYLAGTTRADHVFNYEGTSLGRAYGFVSCNEIGDHGGLGPGRVPVCQFNSPTILDVTTPKGEYLFSTTTRPATIAIHDGVPSCVLNAGIGLQ